MTPPTLGLRLGFCDRYWVSYISTAMDFIIKKKTECGGRTLSCSKVSCCCCYNKLKEVVKWQAVILLPLKVCSTQILSRHILVGQLDTCKSQWPNVRMQFKQSITYQIQQRLRVKVRISQTYFLTAADRILHLVCLCNATGEMLNLHCR